jgi:hypothetical protein
MKRRSCLLALLPLLPLWAAPALAAAATLLQPTTGERGLQMEVANGRAWLLRASGQRLRLPLRRGEEIEELVEFEDGWAAAGSRTLGERRELAVIVDGAAGVERLRPVPEPIGQLRVRPVPMASSTAFAGLAWLEGDSPSTFEVRAADWDGAAWELPETVSAKRPGGQAGLIGTVLDDGRWLLVWSASDGGDTDLVWTVRQDGRWAQPRRLAAANDVPDITPSLVRVPGGALIVWAQRHGAGYRLQTSRFRDGWEAPRQLGAAPAFYPRFAELTGTGRFLLHRVAGGWAALEVDANGRELRRAEIPGERGERPVLHPAGGGVGLRWQRGESARALRWEQRR